MLFRSPRTILQRAPGGRRIRDVTSSRIVRGGLARIEPGWIVSGRARIARAGVDSVALGSHRVSRAFLTGSGGRLFRGVWTRLPGVMRGVVEDGGARSAGKRAAPSLTMVSADWRGAERGEAGPAVMTRSSHLRVCWGSRPARTPTPPTTPSPPGVLGESARAQRDQEGVRVVSECVGGVGRGGIGGPARSGRQDPGAGRPGRRGRGWRPVPAPPRRSSRMVGSAKDRKSVV